MGHSAERRTAGHRGGSRIRCVPHDRSEHPYQQNLAGRKIAVVILGKGRWRLIKNRLPAIAAAVAAATPGSFARLRFRSIESGGIGRAGIASAPHEGVAALRCPHRGREDGPSTDALEHFARATRMRLRIAFERQVHSRTPEPLAPKKTGRHSKLAAVGECSGCLTRSAKQR